MMSWQGMAEKMYDWIKIIIIKSFIKVLSLLHSKFEEKTHKNFSVTYDMDSCPLTKAVAVPIHSWQWLLAKSL